MSTPDSLMAEATCYESCVPIGMYGPVLISLTLKITPLSSNRRITDTGEIRITDTNDTRITA